MSDIFYTCCRNPRFEIPRYSRMPFLYRLSSIFIYFINGRFSDTNGCKFLAVKLSLINVPF